MQEIEELRSSDSGSHYIYKTIVGGMSRLAGSSSSERKRAVRPTDGLSGHQANGVIAAAFHARRIGLPLNRHVTIRLEQAGISDGDAVWAIGGFLTRLRDWLRKKGHRTAFTWVRECGPIIGSHVHILLHLPPGVSLTGQRSRRWIEAISGRPYRAGTIKTKRIPQSAYDENLSVLVGYLCKGASPEVADALGLDRRKTGGRALGKRAGWSENIGQKARRQWIARGGRGNVVQATRLFP
ncbi:hypothetical protein LZ496_05780 [Sphingomonas sp. NSE70-1]|uniref:Replication-associated protein ORF2/G2P domain-containing protein n=1 Tax=Sphingomonas caseinilyticus TaxID=2908205 RepID=A0ABT0RTI4_9SPHN|nr:hypothetical protein [Sphingomonas caseinilyticus]MCL6698290.1 hypothetical protein [Sphingomonas caseinilyticus]